uniref:RNA-dependent RNA polymerase n=1 Tax=Mangifera indica latent virus TaxID=1814004 RepID=A0A142D7P7_9VIRU|nr:RNA-dependent RNA polymerase [Mangifera indica latent virus]
MDFGTVQGLDCYKAWGEVCRPDQATGLLPVWLAITQIPLGIPLRDITIVGQGFIHVLDSYTNSNVVLAKLVEMYYSGKENWIIGSGITAAQMINVAKSAEAAQIALSAAQKSFVDEMATSLVIKLSLNEAQQNIVRRELEFMPLFEPSKKAPQDHAVLAALREAMRWVYESMVNPTTTRKKTLVVGAAMREVKAYNANSAVHYYFANKDSKDINRIALAMLEEVLKTKYKNLKADERKVINSLKDKGLIAGKYNENTGMVQVLSGMELQQVLDTAKLLSKGKIKSAVSATVSLHEMVRLVAEENKIPGHFKFEVANAKVTGNPDDVYTQLLFEDVGYNFAEDDWLDIFDKTEACVGHGYMSLPLDLVYENYPANDMYRYWEFDARKTVVSYTAGKKRGVIDSTFHCDGPGTIRVNGINSEKLMGLPDRPGIYACMTNWNDNGYVHNKEAWSTLLRSPIIHSKKYNFSLEVNLHTRYGPLVGFSLHRVQSAKLTVRTLCLKPKDEYVLLLDLPYILKQVKDHGASGLKKPFRYLSVYRQEFDTVVSWGMSIAEKSLTMGAVSSFVKAHINGVSLINKELVSKWRLRPADQCRFVYCVYFYIKNLRLNLETDAEDLAGMIINWRQRFASFIKSIVDAVVKPFEFLWAWLYHESIVDQLVIEPSAVKYQWDVSKLTEVDLEFSKHMAVTNAFIDEESEMPEGWEADEWISTPDVVKQVVKSKQSGVEDRSTQMFTGKNLTESMEVLEQMPDKNKFEVFLQYGGHLKGDDDVYNAMKLLSTAVLREECEICMCTHGALGAQILDCGYKKDSTFTFHMSQQELDNFRNELLRSSTELGNKYANVIENAHKIVPKMEFSWTGRVEYIKGGPGTGKSYLIRTLADALRDLVVAPFIKLRSDYQNQPTALGEVSWNFQTPHKALEYAGKLFIYVDEFTAYEWRLLTCLLYRCGTETVYLVGDVQQTGILESQGEGISILSKLDMSAVSQHTLLVNFRNPVVDCRFLNSLYDVYMIPRSKCRSGIKFRKITDFAELAKDSNYRVIHFSTETGRCLLDSYNEDGKTTVRANQGSTYDHVLLPVTNFDENLVRIDELVLVALSRHRLSLTILHDDHPSPAVNEFLMKVQSWVKSDTDDALLNHYMHGTEKVVAGGGPGRLVSYFRRLVNQYGTKISPVCSEAGNLINPGKVVSVLIRTLEGRKNKCLITAICNAMQVDEAYVDSCCRKRRSAWYLSWLESEKKSDWLDCKEIALALDIKLVVNVSDNGNNFSLTTGQGKQVVINYTTSSDSGHFSCAMKPVPTYVCENVVEEEVNHGRCLLVIMAAFTVARHEAKRKMSESLQDVLKKRDAWIRREIALKRRKVVEDNFRNTKCKINLNKAAPFKVSTFDVEEDFVEKLTALFFERKPTKENIISTIKKVYGVTSDAVVSNKIRFEPELEFILNEELSDFKFNATKKTLMDSFLEKISFRSRSKPDSQSCVYELFDTVDRVCSDSFAKFMHISGGDDNVLPSQRFQDYALEFVPKMVATLPNNVELCGKLTVPQPKHVPDFDSFILTKSFDLDCGALEYYPKFFNEEASNKVGDKFVTGQLDLSIISPLNMRGHPEPKTVKYRSLMVGPALTYFGRNHWQTLQVQQERYLFRKVTKLPDFKGEKLAKQIGDMFVDDCLDPSIETTFRHNNICHIVERALLDMVSKNYEGQMDMEFTVNSRVYRFQLKDIEKPFKEPFVKPMKSGQGILAWSKEAHVKFMIAFRVINAIMLDSMKPNVVYDNTYSEDTFVEKINAAMQDVPSVAINGIIDATACDSGQSRFTQLIERRIYQRLGLSEFMLDWYFSFREHYIMQSKFVRASMVNVKTSGEPGTLLGNTILMGAMLNAMLRGQGPMAMAIKGDDGFKRQMNLKVNRDMVEAIKQQTILKFKLDLDVPVTFCGYALSDALYPNIVRKLIKISTHRFRDYAHFCEYQISLRDWVNKIPVGDKKIKKFLEVNAKLAGRSEVDMMRCFNQIVSFSRIGKDTFEEWFTEREVEINNVPHDTQTENDYISELPVNLDDDTSGVLKLLHRVKI